MAIIASERGVIGDGLIDDTTAMQDAVDEASGEHTVVDITGLNVRITSPLVIKSNSGIIGDLFASKTKISPDGCSCFIMDGSLLPGGFLFNVRLSNFTIDNVNATNTLPYSILLHDSYRVNVENIRMIRNSIKDDQTEEVFKITGVSNFNYIHRLIILGLVKNFSGCAFSLANVQGKITVDGLDVENCNTGIHLKPSCMGDLYNTNQERNRNNFIIDSGVDTERGHTPFVNINGGIFALHTTTSKGIIFRGTFSRSESINISNLMITSDDHELKRNAFDVTEAVWQNKNKINISNMDFSWIDVPPKLLSMSNLPGESLDDVVNFTALFLDLSLIGEEQVIYLEPNRGFIVKALRFLVEDPISTISDSQVTFGTELQEDFFGTITLPDEQKSLSTTELLTNRVLSAPGANKLIFKVKRESDFTGRIRIQLSGVIPNAVN